MKQVEEEGFKYLRILQLDNMLNKEMKEKTCKEYLHGVKKICKSKLNLGNFVIGLNAWAIGIVRYSRGSLIGHWKG